MRSSHPMLMLMSVSGLLIGPRITAAQMVALPLRAEQSIPFSLLGISAVYSASTLSGGSVLLMTGGGHVAVLLSPDAETVARFTANDLGDGAGAARGGVVGDQVWLKKSLDSRATLYGSDGKRLRVADLPSYFQMPNGDPAPLGPSGGMGGPVLVGMLPDDSFIVTALIPGSATIPTSWGRPPRASTVFLRTDRKGTIQNVVGWSPGSGACAFNGSYLPLCQQPVHVLAAGGQYMATLDAPTLGNAPTIIDAVVVGARGDTLYRVAIPFVARPVSKHEIDSVTARVLASKRVTEFPNGADSIGKVFLPTVHPPIDGAVIGNDGTLWVGLSVPLGEGQRYAVVDPSGRLSYILVMPPEIELVGVGSHVAWGVRQVSQYHELVKLTW